MEASACSFPARNSDRAQTPFFARLRPRLLACPTRMWTSRSRTPGMCLTAVPRLRLAPPWWLGKLVASAAQGLEQTLIGSGLLGTTYTAEEFRAACRKYVAAHGQFRSFARYEQPANIFWDDQNYRGEAYAAFAWAVYVAEVSVDLTTYSVSVDDFVALQEIGRVLNPVLARGQIVGGVAQGIGFALYEKVEWRDGRMQNGQMTNYIMPTSADVPPIRVFFRGNGQYARSVRRQRHRRTSDGRTCPGNRKRHRRCAGDSVRFDSAAAGRYFRRDACRIEPGKGGACASRSAMN